MLFLEFCYIPIFSVNFIIQVFATLNFKLKRSNANFVINLYTVPCRGLAVSSVKKMHLMLQCLDDITVCFDSFGYENTSSNYAAFPFQLGLLASPLSLAKHSNL